MAVLSTADRWKVMGLLGRTLRAEFSGTTMLKADFLAAVDAADNWADIQASAYNLALPQPFRSQASPALKAALLGYVAMRRAGFLPAPED